MMMGDVDDLRIMSMLGFGSAIDWVAVFSFFAISMTYFLAPILGYAPERRGSLSAALYLLLAYAGMAVLQFGVLFLGIMDRGGRRPDELTGVAVFGFAILKLVFFFLALLLYVMELHALRLARREGSRDVRRDEWEEGGRYGER